MSKQYLRSAISRSATKRIRLEKKQKKSEWKTGRESHVVTMSPFAWHNALEISKAENKPIGDFFESIMICFMEWYKTEYLKRKQHAELTQTKGFTNDFFGFLAAEFFKTQMEYKKFYFNLLELNSMPEFSEFSKNKKPEAIYIESGCLHFLKSAILKKEQQLRININLIDAIEAAIFEFVNNMDEFYLKQSEASPTLEKIKPVTINIQ